jgi:hypothetical protein
MKSICSFAYHVLDFVVTIQVNKTKQNLELSDYPAPFLAINSLQLGWA